jgi:hypothetical protein
MLGMESTINELLVRITELSNQLALSKKVMKSVETQTETSDNQDVGLMWDLDKPEIDKLLDVYCRTKECYREHLSKIPFEQLLNWALETGHAEMGRTYTHSKLVQIAAKSFQIKK